MGGRRKTVGWCAEEVSKYRGRAVPVGYKGSEQGFKPKAGGGQTAGVEVD